MLRKDLTICMQLLSTSLERFRRLLTFVCRILLELLEQSGALSLRLAERVSLHWLLVCYRCHKLPLNA